MSLVYLFERYGRQMDVKTTLFAYLIMLYYIHPVEISL